MTQSKSRTLLLAVDGSAHANCTAEYLAHYAAMLGNSQIVVLHVRSAESALTPADAPNANEPYEKGMDAIANVRRILDSARLAYRLDIQIADPVDAITRSAQFEQVDEIVMGSRGMSQWQGLALGSVALQVVHRVEVPVTIVGFPVQETSLQAAKEAKTDRVLLAADGSEPAARATAYICTLRTSNFPVEVELLHVAAPVPSSSFLNYLNEEVIERYVRDTCARAMQEATQTLHAYDALPYAHC